MKYLECSCTSPEHTVRFAKDEDYVFGYKCRYDHFDEVILDREEVKKLISVLREAADE
jgi:hypothetical protein